MNRKRTGRPPQLLAKLQQLEREVLNPRHVRAYLDAEPQKSAPANRLVARLRALEAEGHSPAWIEAVIEADIQAEARRLMETRLEFAHDPEGARRAALRALA